MNSNKYQLNFDSKTFASLWNERKKVVIKPLDYDYKEGDILLIKEYDPFKNTYSGKQLKCLVTYVVKENEGMIDGYAIMSIQVLIKENLKFSKL